MINTKTKTQETWPALSEKPFYETDQVRLYRGDSLQLSGQLQQTDQPVIDAVITDPPYCSGAGTNAGRSADPRIKYCQKGRDLGRPSFDGDVKDPRSYALWCSIWLSSLRAISLPSAYCLVFSDWRMQATVQDAIQVAGWTYRGMIAWNKGRGTRVPHKGYFRHQNEFIPWASNGGLNKLTDRGPFDGCYSIPVRQKDKHHMTGKPTELMRQLVQVAPVGGLVVDPFAGSGSTGVAAVLEGRRALLIEQSEEYCEIAAKRLEAAAKGEILDWVKTA